MWEHRSRPRQGVDPDATVDLSSWSMMREYRVSTKLQPKVVDANKYVDNQWTNRRCKLAGKAQS